MMKAKNPKKKKAERKKARQKAKTTATKSRKTNPNRAASKKLLDTLKGPGVLLDPSGRRI